VSAFSGPRTNCRWSPGAPARSFGAMRTAIVTGASRGLGLELARALAGRGRRLVIDARDAADLEQARADLAAGTDVVAIVGDVADPAHRAQLVGAAGADLELLVNNASTLGASPPPALADIALETLAAVFAVNAIAPLALAQLALAHLPAGGRIVNVTSDAAVEA